MLISSLETALWVLSGVCFVASFVLKVSKGFPVASGPDVRRQAPQAKPVFRQQDAGPALSAKEPPQTCALPFGAASSSKEAGHPREGRGVEESRLIGRIKEKAREGRDKLVGEFFLDRGLIRSEALRQALELRSRYGGSVTQYLLHLGALDETQLAHGLSLYAKVPYLPLKSYEIASDVLRLVPVDIAQKYRVMPLDRQGESLMVVMVDPLDTEAVADLGKITGLTIVPMVGLASEIDAAARVHYRLDLAAEKMHAARRFVDTQAYAGAERRAALRYKADLDVIFLLGDRYRRCRSIDIGREGLGFMCDEPVDPGVGLKLEIGLSASAQGEPVRAAVQVVRCVPRSGGGFLVGARTTAIDPESREVLISCASRSAGPHSVDGRVAP